LSARGPEPLESLVPLLRGAQADMVTQASGTSMGPAFAAGVAIRISGGGLDSIQVGDVVAVARGDRFVAHRVVHVGSGPRAGYLITRGDVSFLPDPPMSQSRVVGRVTHIQVNGDWVTVPPCLEPRGRLTLAAVRWLFARHVPSAIWVTRAAHRVLTLGRRARHAIGKTIRSRP
jgi:signal peptidase I